MGQDQAGIGVPHLQGREQDVERDGHQHGREHVGEERAEGEGLLAREGEAGEAVAGQGGGHHVQHDGAHRRDQAVGEVADELGGEEQLAVVAQREVEAEELVGRPNRASAA